MTQTLTYFADSAAAQSFARVHGDRLQNLDKPQRMFILLSLAHSLFDDQTIDDACIDVDPEANMPDDLIDQLVEQFDGQDEQTLIAMIQAVAMTLGD
jgi:hypothetical protein